MQIPSSCRFQVSSFRFRPHPPIHLPDRPSGSDPAAVCHPPSSPRFSLPLASAPAVVGDDLRRRFSIFLPKSLRSLCSLWQNPALPLMAGPARTVLKGWRHPARDGPTHVVADGGLPRNPETQARPKHPVSRSRWPSARTGLHPMAKARRTA